MESEKPRSLRQQQTVQQQVTVWGYWSPKNFKKALTFIWLFHLAIKAKDPGWIRFRYFVILLSGFMGDSKWNKQGLLPQLGAKQWLIILYGFLENCLRKGLMSLVQCLSKVNGHINHPGICWNACSDSVGLNWCLGFCISEQSRPASNNTLLNPLLYRFLSSYCLHILHAFFSSRALSTISLGFIRHTQLCWWVS